MIEKEFFTWIKQHGGALVGEPIYGLYRKSIGGRLYDQGWDMWAQVSHHASEDAAQLFVSRMRKKDHLPVQAPLTVDIKLLNGHHVAHTMAFIDSPPLSSNLVLDEVARVPSFFLRELASILHDVSQVPQSFVSFRQNVITRRVREYHRVSNSLSIKNWATIHGDLNWSNIAENGTILGWHNWGVGPKDMDAAWLYVLSLKNKNVTRNIEIYFPDLLGTCDGLVCLLFVCTELLRKEKIFRIDQDMCTRVENLSKNILKRLNFGF